MAAVWITEIKNFSRQHQFTLRQNDGTWHPIIGGRRYMQDEPIDVAPRHDVTIRGVPEKGVPDTVIPDAVTQLNCQYFFVGWTDFARTQIQGPGGILNVMVGPTGAGSGNDFLRIFDERENEVASVEMGPRGSGAIASLDLHLNFDEDNVRWVIWNQNGVGAAILQRADEAFRAAAPQLLLALVA
jgi:hypothetical protein